VLRPGLSPESRPREHASTTPKVTRLAVEREERSSSAAEPTTACCEVRGLVTSRRGSRRARRICANQRTREGVPAQGHLKLDVAHRIRRRQRGHQVHIKCRPNRDRAPEAGSASNRRQMRTHANAKQYSHIPLSQKPTSLSCARPCGAMQIVRGDVIGQTHRTQRWASKAYGSTGRCATTHGVADSNPVNVLRPPQHHARGKSPVRADPILSRRSTTGTAKLPSPRTPGHKTNAPLC